MPRKKKAEPKKDQEEKQADRELTLYERVREQWVGSNEGDEFSLKGRFFHLLNAEEKVTARGLVIDEDWTSRRLFCLIFRQVGDRTLVQHRLFDHSIFETDGSSGVGAAFYQSVDEMVAAEKAGLVIVG